eukprot:6337656-Pyramimonas_sp.AAC.1
MGLRDARRPTGDHLDARSLQLVCSISFGWLFRISNVISTVSGRSAPSDSSAPAASAATMSSLNRAADLNPQLVLVS